MKRYGDENDDGVFRKWNSRLITKRCQLMFKHFFKTALTNLSTLLASTLY